MWYLYLILIFTNVPGDSELLGGVTPYSTYEECKTEGMRQAAYLTQDLVKVLFTCREVAP